MKKCFSLLLTLAMLLSMVPAVSAAEDAIELPIGPTMTEEEIEMALEEEATAIRRAEADLRAAEITEETYVTDLPEASVLGASNITIKGTITLPAAYTGYGENRLSVYAVTPAVTDETGRVIEEPEHWGYYNIELDKGDTTATYKLDVPAGNYSLAVYNRADCGASKYSYTYFNGDGTSAATEYTAKPASFTSGSTVNLTMPKAQRTISGTLQFSEPLAEDTHISVYGYNQNSYGNGRIDTYFEVAKGQKSVDFSFYAEPGTYPLEFSAKRWGYADIYGQFSNDYDSRMYFNVETESISGVVLNGDYLLKSYEESDRTGYEVEVEVKLPEATSAWSQYMTILWDEDNATPWDYYNCSVQRGEDTAYAYFWVEDGMNYSISYIECTNWSNFNWVESYPANRFLGEKGTTWNRDEAKVFTCEGTDSKVVFADTDNYKVTGTLKLPAAETTEFAAYAMAASGDISFGDRVIFYSGETEKDFTIYVPTAYKAKEFTVSGYKAAEGRSLFLNSDTCAAGDTFVLNGNQAVTDITLPEALPSVAGTFTLPEGMTAPAEGLAVRFYCSGSSTYYIMAPGQSSLNYKLYVDLPKDEDQVSVSYEILNCPKDLYAERWFYFDPADAMEANLEACGAVTLSGTVTVPDSCKDGASSFQIYFSGNDTDGRTYVTVMPGKTTASFSIPAPKDLQLRIYSRLRGDSSGSLLSANLYLQADGSTSTNSDRVTLTGDTSINFDQPRGNIITGTITVPVEGYYEGRVYANPTSGGSSFYSPTFSFEGTQGTYTMAVPTDYTGTYKLYVSLNESPAGVMTDNLYYNESGVPTNHSEATEVTVPESGFTADFSIPRAKTVSGTVTLFEGLSSNNMNVNVYAWTDTEESYNSYSTYVNMNGSTGDYQLNLPLDYTGNYLLGLRVYYYNDNVPEGLINDTNLYLTADGWTTNRDQAARFTITEDGLTQDMAVPKGISTRITLNAPEGFSGSYGGQMRLNPVESGSSQYKNFEFEGDSTTFAFSALPGDTTEYTLRVYLDYGDGVMTNRYYYYAGDGVWVTDSDDATPITLGNGDLELTMPSGKQIYGKLVSTSGDAVRVDSNDCSLYLSGDNSISQSVKISEDGSFSITIPDDASGEYSLRFYTDSNTNVIGSTYYYLADATASCTNRNEATMIDVSGDIPELTLLVDTGYVLTGSIQLDKGAVLSSSNDWNTFLATVYFRLDSETLQYNTNVSLYSEEPWTYSFVVPKTEATYDLYISSVNLGSSSSLTSNIFTGDFYSSGLGSLGSITVTGDATLPTAYLTNWDANCEELLLQSEHGFKYSNLDTSVTYTYTYPVSGWVDITFDERTDMKLIVNEQTIWSPGGETYRINAPDGVITVSYYTDTWYNSSAYFFGFGITSITSEENTDAAGFGAVSSEDGYNDAAVLNALDEGEDIRVAMSGPADATATVLAAIYDDSGRMIGLELVEVEFTNGSAVANVSFDNGSDADSLKLMLLDSLLAPFSTAMSYSR